MKENFIFAGKFKLPAGTPSEDIIVLAEETMANLGLTRVANSMVGNVNVRGVKGMSSPAGVAGAGHSNTKLHEGADASSGADASTSACGC